LSKHITTPHVISNIDPSFLCTGAVVREDGEFVNPWEDAQYDAKVFPTLFPFGLGGLPGAGHGVSNMELERLHLCRGGDFRYQQSMRYIFEKFTRRQRKAAGAVALIASEFIGQGTATLGTDDKPTGAAPGIALGDPMTELGKTLNQIKHVS
jgi:hypothetical protein